MKKKGFIIIGFVVILVVFVGMLLFISSPSQNVSGTASTSLEGTWYVYQRGSESIENEIMIFSETSASDYRDNNDNPVATSTYAYDSDGHLHLPDMSREFTVQVISDNNIILIEPNTLEWKLIRVADLGQPIEEVTSEKLQGEYEVKMVAGESRTNEIMIFTENQLTDYRDGAEYISCSYEMNAENLLYAAELSKDYAVFVNSTAVMLIDKEDNYVWELTHKK